MSDPARRTRRAIGLAFLASAVLLLFAGQTVLRDHLHGTRFALYWLLCLLLVAVAMAVALLDLFAVRHQARRQQLDLIQNTLGAPGTARPPARKPTSRDTHHTSTNRVRSADPEIQS